MQVPVRDTFDKIVYNIISIQYVESLVNIDSASNSLTVLSGKIK